MKPSSVPLTIPQRLTTALLGGALLLLAATPFALIDDLMGLPVCMGLLLAVAAALLVEPAPRAPTWRIGLAAGLAGLAAWAVPVLWEASENLPPEPYLYASDVSFYKELLLAAAHRPLAALPFLLPLGAVAALPLLLVRQQVRELEHQLAAAALGGLLALAPLATSQGLGGARLLLLGPLATAQVGAVGYLLDRRWGTTRLDPEERRTQRPWLAGLAAAALLSLPLGLGVDRVGKLLIGAPPARDDARLVAALAAIAPAQERYRAAHGRCAPTLAALDGIDPDLTRGVLGDHVIRYATFGQGEVWMLAADPVPPHGDLARYWIDAAGTLRRVNGPARLWLEEQ